ncbi:hypothetical protein GCM10022631_26000 [Deinococcus rubellus]|uniref:type IV toxin-antitoxin system AbiEi family antitoxin domain-containing protein n=1 Tax=Deinococcus rubellus TaxID=1889240 RepID=UPI0031F17A3D
MRQAGLPLKVVQRLTQAGRVQVVQRGVYQLLSLPAAPHAELLEVSLRGPYARVTLVSALNLHGLTTTQPVRLQLTIPSNRAFPDLAFPPVQVFWFPPEVHAAGVQDWQEAEVSFPVYPPEKTIADLLRLEWRLGRDLSLEGLRTDLLPPDRRVPELLAMARVCGVEVQLRRDLEMLHTADH